jgi:WD40 repeat protein
MNLKNKQSAIIGSIEVTKQSVIKHAHVDEIYVLAGSSDGKAFVSAGRDKTINLWSCEGQKLFQFSGHIS